MSNEIKNRNILGDDCMEMISDNIKPATLAPSTKAIMHERILSRVNTTSPAGASTIRSSEGNWVEVSPLVKMKILRRDEKLNSQTALWQLSPGAVIPAHNHPVEEECLVLEGEIHFDDHYLYAGDFEVVEAGIDHSAMESTNGALVLLRSDISHDLSWVR